MGKDTEAGKEKSINFNKSLYDICIKDSAVIEIMKELGFESITQPGMLNTAGRFMTIPKGAAMKGIPLERIREIFISKGYELEE